MLVPGLTYLNHINTCLQFNVFSSKDRDSAPRFLAPLWVLLITWKIYCKLDWNISPYTQTRNSNSHFPWQHYWCFLRPLCFSHTIPQAPMNPMSLAILKPMMIVVLHVSSRDDVNILYPSLETCKPKMRKENANRFIDYKSTIVKTKMLHITSTPLFINA